VTVGDGGVVGVAAVVSVGEGGSVDGGGGVHVGVGVGAGSSGCRSIRIRATLSPMIMTNATPRMI
jgi:hypothetical protein